MAEPRHGYRRKLSRERGAELSFGGDLTHDEKRAKPVPFSVQSAGHLRLDRLGGVRGHLGGQRAHFFSLRLQRTELLLPIGGVQFHRLGEVLRRGEVPRQIETGIDVALSDVDDLTV